MNDPSILVALKIERGFGIPRIYATIAISIKSEEAEIMKQTDRLWVRGKDPAARRTASR